MKSRESERSKVGEERGSGRRREMDKREKESRSEAEHIDFV